MTDPHADQSGPSRGRRTRAAVAWVAGAALLAGGVGAGAYYLLSPDEPAAGSGDARTAAERFAQVYERNLDHDTSYRPDEFAGVVCDRDLTRLRDQYQREQARASSHPALPSTTRSAARQSIAVKEVRVADGHGTVTFTRTRTAADGRTSSRDSELDLERGPSGWVVCGLFRPPSATAHPSRSARPTPTR